MNEKKKSSIGKIVLWVVITNLITISVLLIAPIPILGRKLVTVSDYNFTVDYRKLIRVHNILEKKYVDKITPEQEEKMLEGAIKGMTSGLGDPYTVYMNAGEYESFMTDALGTYAGVGIMLTVQDDKIVVLNPIEGGPAVEAGIKSGDVITKVDGKPVSGKESDKAVAMMKGQEGTSVTLTLDRAGHGEMDVKLTRKVIQMKTVKSEVIDNIGYIRISSFDEMTGADFKEHVDKIVSKGVKGIIIDLRGNPGGILDEAIKVLDVFVDDKTVLTTVDNGGKKTQYKTAKGKIDLPLTVLVNKGSASASEIVSGALKDLNAATLIGTTTYGKGLVQATMNLQDKTGLKFTMSRYYTPSGISIQGKGIEPNIKVEIPEGKDIKSLKEDPQVEKAIEVINSK